MKHNENPSFTWKKGVNHLSDRTDQEFARLLGYNKKLAFLTQNERKEREVWPSSLDTSVLPQNVDWRLMDIISEVKDQGECGSCWTFGTAESVESHFALKTGQLGALSEQQIVDCTPNPNQCGGTGGCGGGTPELAYNQIINLNGLSSEWTYPYRSYHGEAFSCKFNTTTTPPVAKLVNYTVLPSNQYEPVMMALAMTGPLAINVDASSWSDYEAGVFSGCDMANPDIDHVVQLVGYGLDERLGTYWLVRNSWSPKWGEDGYIRIARSSNPPCGLDTTPMDGTGCLGGPANVTVCGECALLYDVSYPNVVSASL
jgi:cathepsin L